MSFAIIGITMGDPVGIGPEIIINALAQEEAFARCRSLVFGDANVLEKANRMLSFPCTVKPVRRAEEARGILLST